MLSHGIGIVNEGIRPDRKWLFFFGAYGDTAVLVVGSCSLEDALGCAAEWLADNAPGHLMAHGSEEHMQLLREAASERGMAWDSIEDDEIRWDVAEDAEADLTYTESGYLTSYEWTVCDQPDRETILAVQKR